ncbi:MAG: DegQ family serine endoprotease [Gammaproteobacteria bacterium]|nr:DegQ family serine endoprotease [Gammaproteobacteria bacterium]MDH5660836.1 DegQ family serine endoprotease [Gammaproteobacteria bacterium]
MKQGYRYRLTIKAISFALISLFSLASFASLPLVDSQGTALPSLAPMLKRVTPAVVNIATSGTVRIEQNPLFNDPFFRHFFEMPSQPRHRKTQSLGSGVIVDANKGYIITNNHVIDKADVINVTLRNGETYEAKLIGTDPDSDVAIIQIEAKNLTAIPFANSEELNVGDFAIAIGNPFGLGQTVTSGIISAMERSGLGIEGYENFIQTDASINPGNSGGALVNLNGQLIGINTAIFSKSGGNIGIGFAIPINMANDIMQQLITHGEVKRGRLGAQAQDLTPQLAQAFNIPFRRGAVIAHVEKDSPADLAGLKPGDIVTYINGKVVRNADSLRNTLGLLRIGQTVTMKVLRDKKTLTLTAKVAVTKSSQVSIKGEKLHRHLTGTELQNIQPDSKLYGHIEGVMITSVESGSPAASTGLRRGDIITSANRKAIKNITELQTAIAKNNSLLINIRRGNGSLFLFLQ